MYMYTSGASQSPQSPDQQVMQALYMGCCQVARTRECLWVLLQLRVGAQRFASSVSGLGHIQSGKVAKYQPCPFCFGHPVSTRTTCSILQS
jgi:hypothetical protein